MKGREDRGGTAVKRGRLRHAELFRHQEAALTLTDGYLERRWEGIRGLESRPPRKKKNNPQVNKRRRASSPTANFPGKKNGLRAEQDPIAKISTQRLVGEKGRTKLQPHLPWNRLLRSHSLPPPSAFLRPPWFNSLPPFPCSPAPSPHPPHPCLLSPPAPPLTDAVSKHNVPPPNQGLC